ncbi:MAG: GxxExxY protein [Acetobacteraceae bacterium]|nr:GxxExxY protein [Acetobacteraceae bacterium]
MTDAVIGAAIEVHRELGPGLLESVYEECLCYELQERGIAFRRQLELPIVYKGRRLDFGYRLDMLIENQLLIEVKAVEQLVAIHEAQVLTYLRLSGFQLALLMNFNTSLLKQGLRRFVLSENSASPRLRGESY